MRMLLLSGFLFTTMAFAQGGMGGMGGGGGMGEGGGGRNGGGMAMPSYGPSRITRLERMTSILNLNKNQKKEVKSIMDEGGKQGASLRDQLVKGREQIAEAVASGKSQDQIDLAVKEYAGLEGEMARIELDAFSKIFKLLDSEQRTKSGGVFQMMAGIFSSKNWNES